MENILQNAENGPHEDVWSLTAVLLTIYFLPFHTQTPEAYVMLLP